MLNKISNKYSNKFEREIILSQNKKITNLQIRLFITFRALMLYQVRGIFGGFFVVIFSPTAKNDIKNAFREAFACTCVSKHHCLTFYPAKQTDHCLSDGK